MRAASSTLLLLLVASLPAQAERYVVRVGNDDPQDGWNVYWSGVVDTKTNTLEMTEFFTEPGSNWYPLGSEALVPWPALQPGPNGKPVPFDIPDNNWNGTLNNWGFVIPVDVGPAYKLTPGGPVETGREVQPGFGCVRETGTGVDRLVCDVTPRGRSGLQFVAMWPNEGGIYGVDGNGDEITQLWGQGLGAYERYTLKPESAPETRVVGDVDGNNTFDSQDLILVMQPGRYETDVKGATWEQGDWNYDLLFDSDDMLLAFQGGNYEPVWVGAVVPEPAGATLVLIAFAALIRMRRPRTGLSDRPAFGN